MGGPQPIKNDFAESLEIQPDLGPSCRIVRLERFLLPAKRSLEKDKRPDAIVARPELPEMTSRAFVDGHAGSCILVVGRLGGRAEKAQARGSGVVQGALVRHRCSKGIGRSFDGFDEARF